MIKLQIKLNFLQIKFPISKIIKYEEALLSCVHIAGSILTQKKITL